MSRFATLLGLSLLLASGARGQVLGSCETGTAIGDLDASNVFARVFNTGGLFFGNTAVDGDGYIVPRTSNTSPLFAASLWLGGQVDGELRVAGARYSRYTFWPGPLNEDGTLPDPDDCSAFDRIYTVSVADVTRYEASGEATPDLAEWPVGLGAPAVDASGQPLAVTRRNQTLDLSAGERPVLYGSQTAWWVMNDLGGPHTALETPPLGVEVRASAFAIANAGEDVMGTSEATFYRYEVVNRSPHTIEAMHAGFFSDPDLGTPSDDYVGSDSTRGMGFVYNSREDDLVYGTPPALGFDLLSDAGAFSYFSPGSSGSTPTPTGENDYYRMQGLWGDGTAVRTNGNGYGQPRTFPATRYAFPDAPEAGAYWSEENTNGSGLSSHEGDRRMLVSTPAFELAPGETRVVDLGILFAQGADRLGSITELRAVSDAVQTAYDDGRLSSLGKSLTMLPAPMPLAPEAGQYVGAADSVAFSWTPVAGADGYEVRWGVSPEALTSRWATDETASAIPVGRLLRYVPTSESRFGLKTVYWTVQAIGAGAIGLEADVRSVGVFVDGPLILASGDPAYVEVARGDGGDPCGADAESPDGCDEVGGNLVYRSLNSDGSYYFGDAPGRTWNASTVTLGQFAPNDFEIRFTEEGGLAANYFQWPHNLIRVPFEVWDIGTVAPGDVNDPSDDVRLIPFVLAYNGGVCAFDAAEIPNAQSAREGFVESDGIYASYPESSYADFEGDFSADVEASANGCVPTRDREGLAAYVREGYVIQRQVFGSLESSPALPSTGTIVRLYTADAPPVTATPPPEASGEIALSIAPNPARGAASVRLRLASPEAVTVRVLDMLGREVAVIADGPQASGETALALPADLAAGVYAVEATAGQNRATRLVTVVR